MIVGFAVIAGTVLITATPQAGATPATLSGPCTASGSLNKGGFTVDATESRVVTVPETDDVTWKGALQAPGGEQAYSGKIELELPPPLPKWKIDSWSGTSDSSENNGVKHYDVASFAPRGVEMRLTGEHTQGSVSCSGVVKIKIEGGAFDSPGAPIALVGTAVTGVVLVLSGMAKRETVA